MRKRFISNAKLLLTLALLLGFTSNCSEDAMNEVLHEIDINGTWVDNTNSDHFLVFQAIRGNKTEKGDFNGTEQRVIESDVVQNSLTGSWENNQITFTVNRPSGAILFTNSLVEDNPTTLTFTSSEGTLVLLKDLDEE